MLVTWAVLLLVAAEHNNILCSWATDAGSMTRICSPPGVSETCIPGCSGGEDWCENQKKPLYCPWGKGRLRDMVAQSQRGGGYNEVIVGRDDYESRLPQAVEAVVFTGDDRSKAEAVHAKFLGAYGLAASQVPLLHVAPVKAWYTQWGIESFEET